MSVLHIIVGLDIGGAETMLKRLIESEPEGTPRPVVISLTSLGVIGEFLRSQGVRVHALGMSSALNVPMTLWMLVRMIRRDRPRTVQTWMYHADLLGGLAARLAGGCTVVWGVRSTAIPQGILSVTYWLVRLCALFSHFIPHRIICCAYSAKAAHLKLGYPSDKMVMIPNGYDFSVYDHYLSARVTARQQLGFTDDEIVVGVVGRFDPLKDFHNFIVAASQLVASKDKVKLLMVGRNLEWSNPALRGWIEAVGLEKNFQLLGEQADVPYFLSAMDIFCLSSANEAFPNVVVEAMAMGLPCVVTRAGDAADILGDEAFVVQVKDSVSLADALLRMCDLSPVDRRMLGERNAKKVRAEYGIDNIRQKYEEVYAESVKK